MLKDFIRQLPESLIPVDSIDDWIRILKLEVSTVLVENRLANARVDVRDFLLSPLKLLRFRVTVIFLLI